jgi:hypothetical protein
MAVASVEVPAGLAAAVRESAVLLYQATVEALHFALRSPVGDGEARDEVRRHRARLAGLDALLTQLGWWTEVAPDAMAGELELTAPREVLQDALHGALIDAGERLAVACDESWRDDAGSEEVRAAAVEVIGLDRLLAELRG